MSKTHINTKQIMQHWIKYDTNLNNQYKIITDHEKDIEAYDLSKGTAIIYHKFWDKYKHKTWTYPGRLTAISFRHKQETLLIAAVYMPSQKRKTQHYRIPQYSTPY